MFRIADSTLGGDPIILGPRDDLVAKPREAVGKVRTAIGSVTVMRAGYLVVQVNVGDHVYQGDVIETAPDGAVGITFNDGTAFNLSAGARMELGEFACDPDGLANSARLIVTQGSFAFIAGKVAKAGGLRIDTPFASIRGTAQGGGIGILTLAALTFSAMEQIHAAGPDAISDDGIIEYKDLKDLQAGTIELLIHRTGERVPVNSFTEEVVVDETGTVVRNPMPDSRVAELAARGEAVRGQAAAGEAVSGPGGGTADPGSSEGTPGGGQLGPLDVPATPINFTLPPTNAPPSTTPDAPIVVVPPAQTAPLATPPAAPGVTLAVDSGSSGTDQFTNVGTLTVSGIQTGAVVEYSLDGGFTWSNSFTAVEGPNNVLVRQTVAGQTSSATALNFVLDMTPPEAPTVSTSVGVGTAAAGVITNNNTLLLTGTAEPGTTVTLYDTINGATVVLATATADVNGALSLQIGPLPDGEHVSPRPPLPTPPATPAQPRRRSMSQLTPRLRPWRCRICSRCPTRRGLAAATKTT